MPDQPFSGLNSQLKTDVARTDDLICLSDISANESKKMTVDEFQSDLVEFRASTEITIATGAVTITENFHTIDTESDAPADDLDTINGGSPGQLLFLLLEDSGRVVTLKDGTGNIQLSADYVMVPDEVVALKYDGTNWLLVTAARTSTFLTLPDTPASYAGQASRVVEVNPGETALQFSSVTLLDGTTTVDETTLGTGSSANANTDVVVLGADAQANASGQLVVGDDGKQITDAFIGEGPGETAGTPHDNILKITAATAPTGHNARAVLVGGAISNQDRFDEDVVVIGYGITKNIAGGATDVVIIGASSNLRSSRSVIIGANITSPGDEQCVIIGESAAGSGGNCTVIGWGATVTNNASGIAIGANAGVTADSGIAIGRLSSAGPSIVIGNRAASNDNGQFVVGAQLQSAGFPITSAFIGEGPGNTAGIAHDNILEITGATAPTGHPSDCVLIGSGLTTDQFQQESVVIGNGAVSATTGERSVGIGFNVNIAQRNQVVIGHSAAGGGNSNVVIGDAALANSGSQGVVVVGQNAKGGDSASVTIGSNASTAGAGTGFTIAIGGTAICHPGVSSGIAIGYTADCFNNDSIVLGRAALDNGPNQFVVGRDLYPINEIYIGEGPTGASPLTVAPSTELTIATGAITITRCFHRVDTEADATTDDLETISGGREGQELVIKPEDSARTVVVKHNVGNIQCGTDFTMDNANDTMKLIFDGTNWLELSRSDNGA